MYTRWMGLLALAVSLAACAGPSGPAGGAVVVIGREMRFESSTLTVPAGAPVTLQLRNDGRLEHALVIDALGVVIPAVAPGQTGTATFTPEQPGTYTFYCSVPGHTEAKMTGVLQVTP